MDVPSHYSTVDGDGEVSLIVEDGEEWVRIEFDDPQLNANYEMDLSIRHDRRRLDETHAMFFTTEEDADDVLLSTIDHAQLNQTYVVYLYHIDALNTTNSGDLAGNNILVIRDLTGIEHVEVFKTDFVPLSVLVTLNGYVEVSGNYQGNFLIAVFDPSTFIWDTVISSQISSFNDHSIAYQYDSLHPNEVIFYLLNDTTVFVHTNDTDYSAFEFTLEEQVNETPSSRVDLDMIMFTGRQSADFHLTYFLSLIHI